MRRDFRWRLPARMNLAEELVGRRARVEPDRLAIRHLRGDGRAEDWSFARLDRAGARLANALAALGIGRGDRVGVLLAQSPETIVSHLACYRLGAIPVLLSVLFGEDALRVRLLDSGAALVISDAARLGGLAALRDALPGLRNVICVDGPGEGALDMDALTARASDSAPMAALSPEDPAFLSYTSGTTGPPKGALLPQRVLAGHLPGARLAQGFAPHSGDVFWTPADWAWMGGLCNMAMPALRWGGVLISRRMEKFDAERAFRLMAEQGVTRAFLPPTALRLMRQAPARAREGLRLAGLGSGGESLGAETFAWGREAFGLDIAEIYGQTECNMAISSCPGALPTRPGWIGRATPGFDVAVLDSEGRPAESGEIAVRRGCASMFLGYWGDSDKTAGKFRGDWMLTGDEAEMDGQGYIRFASRADDVITTAGYRVGPSEIEDCLAAHPAVAMAAVVGLVDPVRTEIVAAFVRLAEGAEGNDALGAALAAHVRDRLGGHLTPRRVAFVPEIPVTVTGKVMRREVRRLYAG